MTMKCLKYTTHTCPICCSQVVCTLKPAKSHAIIPATIILRTVVPWLQIQAIHTIGIATGQLVNLQPLNGQPVSPHNSTSVGTGRIPSPENPTGHVCVPTSSTALVLHVSNQINVQGNVKLLGEGRPILSQHNCEPVAHSLIAVAAKGLATKGDCQPVPQAGALNVCGGLCHGWAIHMGTQHDLHCTFANH